MIEMTELKLIMNFDNLEGVAINPVITNLLIQLRDINKVFIDAGEDYGDSPIWEKVDESLTSAITVHSLDYRFSVDEDYTEAEGDAVNDTMQLMLHFGLTVLDASAILSNMKKWDIEQLNLWIAKKEKEFDAEGV